MVPVRHLNNPVHSVHAGVGADANLDHDYLTLIVLGSFGPCDAKSSEKCPCSHNNFTASIKQISMFDSK